MAYAVVDPDEGCGFGGVVVVGTLTPTPEEGQGSRGEGDGLEGGAEAGPARVADAVDGGWGKG